MIEKMNNHYSMNNPASIYDEEALTALELASRTTGKVNECIEAFNELDTYTRQYLKDVVETHIPNNVYKWLDEHPEATTTVQDNSLNINKFIFGELGYITPQMFGAKGDGVTDDTQAIIDAISYIGEPVNKLYFPSGTYLVSADIPLVSNMYVCGDGNTSVIKRVGNNLENYAIFGVYGVDNVVIDNLTIEGERYEHTDTTGEWGMGVSVRGSKNITIKNTNISECWGDAVYIGTHNTLKCENVIIDNCIIDRNRRQGVSVINVAGLIIRNSVIKNTSGTLPEHGIDFESNSETEVCENCVIENCVFEGNGGDVLIGNHVIPYQVTVRNCTLNSKNGVAIANGTSVNSGGGFLNVQSCTFNNSRSCFYLWQKNYKQLPIYVDGCLLKGGVFCVEYGQSANAEGDDLGGFYVTNSSIESTGEQAPLRMLVKKSGGTFRDFVFDVNVLPNTTRKFVYFNVAGTGHINLRNAKTLATGSVAVNGYNFMNEIDVDTSVKNTNITVTLNESVPYDTPIKIRKIGGDYGVHIALGGGVYPQYYDATRIELTGTYDTVEVTHEASGVWSVKDTTRDGVVHNGSEV